MINKTLDEDITALERKLSTASDKEKANLADRLLDLLTRKKEIRHDRIDADDDMFDNVPI